MKQTAFSICLILFLSCLGGPAGAMELDVTGGGNFLTFHPQKLTAYSDPASAMKQFQPYPFIIGSIGLKDDISETLSYNIRLSRDSILRNSVEGTLSLRTDNFSLEFGPFIGMTDTLEMPFMGMLGSIGFTYPGIVFFSLSASSNLTRLGFTSDHTRESAAVKIGFWMPFMIPSFTASYKNFTQQISETHFIQDSLTRLQVSIDFHGKNFPITIRLDGGYQVYSRFYSHLGNEYSDTLNSFFAGGEISWQLRNQTKITIGAELPVIINAASPMTAPLFFTMPKITAGFVYTFK